MLVHRRRRWANIKPTLVQHLLFAERCAVDLVPLIIMRSPHRPRWLIFLHSDKHYSWPPHTCVIGRPASNSGYVLMCERLSRVHLLIDRLWTELKLNMGLVHTRPRFPDTIVPYLWCTVKNKKPYKFSGFHAEKIWHFGGIKSFRLLFRVCSMRKAIYNKDSTDDENVQTKSTNWYHHLYII